MDASELNQEWRERNPATAEKRRKRKLWYGTEAAKEARAKGVEEYREFCRGVAREKARLRAKENYLKDPDAQKKRVQAYEAANPEKVKTWREEYKTKWYKKSMLSAARHRAQKCGHEFNLTEEDLQIPDVCPVLGIAIFPKRGGKTGPGPNSPSLDRLDNTLGYIKGNVQVISHRANGLKSDATIEELRKVLAYVEANEF